MTCIFLAHGRSGNRSEKFLFFVFWFGIFFGFSSESLVLKHGFFGLNFISKTLMEGEIRILKDEFFATLRSFFTPSFVKAVNLSPRSLQAEYEPLRAASGRCEPSAVRTSEVSEGIPPPADGQQTVIPAVGEITHE